MVSRGSSLYTCESCHCPDQVVGEHEEQKLRPPGLLAQKASPPSRSRGKASREWVLSGALGLAKLSQLDSDNRKAKKITVGSCRLRSSVTRLRARCCWKLLLGALQSPKRRPRRLWALRLESLSFRRAYQRFNTPFAAHSPRPPPQPSARPDKACCGETHRARRAAPPRGDGNGERARTRSLRC